MQCISFDRYIECFRILEKYSEEYPLMLRHLRELARTTFPDGFSMLDIGAGPGHFAASFFDVCTVPVHRYTAIEPSADHLLQLHENLRHRSFDCTIIGDYFTSGTQLSETYDLILLSHSVYCFLPDPKPPLLHALRHLNPGGRAVIYNGGPTNFCTYLNLLFKEELPEHRVTDPLFTSFRIRDILEDEGVPHTVTCLPGYLRAEEIFLPENIHLFHELITFSFMVEAESLPERMLARAKETLHNYACPSPGGPLLNLETDAIVIMPACNCHPSLNKWEGTR